jgi:ribosomal protein S18 acetylase RimI-like enzyme
MDHILEKFRDCQIAYLEVRSSNSAAISLYHRYGFHKLYLRPAYYSDGEDAIVMKKDLLTKG